MVDSMPQCTTAAYNCPTARTQQVNSNALSLMGTSESVPAEVGPVSFEAGFIFSKVLDYHYSATEQVLVIFDSFPGQSLRLS